MKAVHYWQVCTTLLLATAGLTLPGNAQVVPDGTLSTTVSQSGNNFTITNGTTQGNNLFQSFSQFSVPTGGSALFNNAATIQNIFARVTGGSVSNIDGLIRANGSANLFLLNPSGILFGPNASLNLGGSFVGTTADSILFADGTKFSDTDTTAPPLLTVSVPIGLQLGAKAGSIQVQGKLQVPTGQTLALAGSQIDMTGATLTVPDGRIELWAVQNAQIGMDTQPWQLNSPATTAHWGTITLQQASLVDASGINGGAINVRGRGLTLQDGSNITSKTLAGQGKGITVDTTEFVDLLGNASTTLTAFDGISTSVDNGIGIFGLLGTPTTGRAGDVTVTTGHLRMSNAAWLQSITTGNNSRTGDITIRATDVDLMGYETLPGSSATSIVSLVFAGSNNQSGQVTIDAQRISLLDGSRISSSVFGGNGQAGNVSIQAAESLDIQGTTQIGGISSAVLVSLEAGTTGQGGHITIDAGSLILANGGSITSEVAGSKTSIFGSLPGAQGTAGNIDIRANNVQVSDPIIDGFSQTITGITASLGNGAVGTGGTINLVADNLRVFNGGQITSSSKGNGPAGDVNLNVNTIDVQGLSKSLINGQYLPSAITASAVNAFAAGSVSIAAETVQVRDAAQISVSNTGTGDSGNLNVNARNLFLDTGASLRAEANGGGQGNIQLQVSDVLLLRHGSNITTNAQGASTGGNININARFIVAVPLENSDIVANAVLGSGGNIQITTQGIFGLKFRPKLTPDNDITASSQFGVSGTIDITTPGIDPTAGLVSLPVELVDPAQQIATGYAGTQGSSFIATGRGGVPQKPTQQMTGDRTWEDLRDLSAYRKAGKTVAQRPAAVPVLLQASTWQRHADGTVELIADQASAMNSTFATCSGVTGSAIKAAP